MLIDMNLSAVYQVNVDPAQAFDMLCKTLEMEFVMDEDTRYFVYADDDGDNHVYKTVNGCDHCVDDRGDLFLALREVAVNMFPNVSFRHEVIDRERT